MEIRSTKCVARATGATVSLSETNNQAHVGMILYARSARSSFVLCLRSKKVIFMDKPLPRQPQIEMPIHLFT